MTGGGNTISGHTTNNVYAYNYQYSGDATQTVNMASGANPNNTIPPANAAANPGGGTQTITPGP